MRLQLLGGTVRWNWSYLLRLEAFPLVCGPKLPHSWQGFYTLGDASRTGFPFFDVFCARPALSRIAGLMTFLMTYRKKFLCSQPRH